MKDLVYYSELFELYSDLLTDKEKEAFKDYYFEDLSLSEIAENNDISRAAVSKMVNTVVDKLKYYESIIHKHEMKDLINKSLSSNDLNDIKSILNDINNL